MAYDKNIANEDVAVQGDGAHTHPSYDSKLADLERRIVALEGGGKNPLESSLEVPPKSAFGG